MTGTTLQFTPQTTLQLVGGAATGTTLQLSPTVVTGQALQLTPQTTLQLAGGASTGSTLTFAVQNRGTQTLNLGSGGANVDTAYQVLTLGFGNNPAKVVRLEQALNDKLDTLSSGVGGILSNVDLGAILLNTAKGFLNDNGFGFLINDAVEPILGSLISKVIANRQAKNNGNQPASTAPAQISNPVTNVSAGGQSFNISGRIVLTPSTGGSTTPTNGPTGVTPSPTGVTPSPPGITTDPGVNAAPVIP